jgi:hypothetical protein
MLTVKQRLDKIIDQLTTLEGDLDYLQADELWTVCEDLRELRDFAIDEQVARQRGEDARPRDINSAPHHDH